MMWHHLHISMSHVTHINELFLTFESVMSHIRLGLDAWCDITCTYAWVMSHICMSHVTHMHESCRTHAWVMSHIRLGLHVWCDITCTYTRVMSHICMSHVTHMHESCHITHLNEFFHESCDVTHMNESWHTWHHTHAVIMEASAGGVPWHYPHTEMSHITYMKESCHTYEWVMSCHMCEWVMSHIWMSTHMKASCHINRTCHINEVCVCNDSLAWVPWLMHVCVWYHRKTPLYQPTCIMSCMCHDSFI